MSTPFFTNHGEQTLPRKFQGVFESNTDIEPSHRYVCLLGCWFRNPEYLAFHTALEGLKRAHLPHHPDDPPICTARTSLNR